MIVAPPPPAWVEWVSMGGVLVALGYLIRIGMWIGDIRRQVHTMWESWLFEHAHILPPARGRVTAPKQGTTRDSG